MFVGLSSAIQLLDWALQDVGAALAVDALRETKATITHSLVGIELHGISRNWMAPEQASKEVPLFI
jgi:hypothetical protein